MKKGFTLIELLAVIVILAIIALIATPIVLNIIDETKNNANKRSIDMYAKAVENAVARYQLNEDAVPTSIAQLKEKGYVEMDGTVSCTTEKLYADGTVYLEGCTVNGTSVDYTYGINKPQYYSWSSGNIGGNLPSDSKPTVAELNPSYPFYIGLDVDSNNKVSAAYVCLKKEENGPEYCLKGGDDGASYTANQTVLADAFGESACSFSGGHSYCSAGDLDANATSYGGVDALDGYVGCGVIDGGFECSEV